MLILIRNYFMPQDLDEEIEIFKNWNNVKTELHLHGRKPKIIPKKIPPTLRLEWVGKIPNILPLYQTKWFLSSLA